MTLTLLDWIVGMTFLASVLLVLDLVLLRAFGYGIFDDMEEL